VAIDSTFAMAFYELSKVSDGKERAIFADAARRHANHASPKERAMIEIFHTSTVRKDHRKAMGLIQDFVRRYPTEPLGYLEMSFTYDDLGRKDSAVLALERLVVVDPLQREAYNLLAYRSQDMGNFDRSVWAINKYINLAPHEPNPYDSRADLYAYEGKLEEAARYYAQVLTIDPDFSVSSLKLGFMLTALEQYDSAAALFQSLTSSATVGIRSGARFALAAIPARQGLKEPAILRLQQGIAAGTLEAKEESLSGFYWAEARLRAEWGDTSGAIDVIQRSAVSMDSAVLADRMWLRHLDVELLARSGRLAEADSLVRRFEVEWKRFGPIEENDVYYACLGALAGARGKRQEAVERYEEASRHYSDFLVRCWLGRAYLEAGMLSSAVDTLEAAAKRFDEPRFYSTVDDVTVYYHLGQAYELSGWNDKAIESYAKFLHVWRNADPVPAKVTDARARLAKLQSAS
jgi:predicted Zn-dependent protease